MRIAVFGAGAVGGYFGGRLAQAGEQVTFIARGAHLQAMQRQGLRLDSVQGDFVVKPVAATSEPAEIGKVDAVLLAVKAWQVPEAAEAMQPLLGPETVVLPLQNGVEAPAQLADILGEQHVLGGLCKIISFIHEPGQIRHVGASPYVAFGELDNRPSERTRLLHDAFARAEGVTPEIPPDIHRAMWEKFLLIASFSGLGAVTRAPIGVVRSLPETRAMLQQAMREVSAVARARDVHLPDEAERQAMAFVDNLPPAATASMQRDIAADVPSELESQNGAVVRLGREVGVDVPLHHFIYSSLLPSELKARGKYSAG